MSLTYVNFLLSLLSLTNSVSNSKSITKIERKLNFIRDDISWLGSNDGGKLIKEMSDLRLTYERELAKIHIQLIDGELFKQDISSLVENLEFSNPEFFNFILDNNVKIYDLVTLSSHNIIELYRISEELAVRIEEAVSSISMVALKYGMSLQELSLKVDSNEKYIFVLSQKLIDVQSQLNSQFAGIKDELNFIQAEVDRQLKDIGLATNSTTAVILSDGSLHISENLTRYTGSIFVGNTETKLVSGSSSSFMNLVSSSSTTGLNKTTGMANQNRAALSFSTQTNGATRWSHSAAFYSNTTKLKNIIPIKDDQGALLDLSISKDIIIRDVNLNQPIFVILRGGGLSEITFDGIIPMFRPAMISQASLSIRKTTQENGEGGGNNLGIAINRSAFSIAEATVGAPGTFIIPVSNAVTTYPQFLRIGIQSKSDNLIILKIDRLPGWNSLLGSGTENGGYVNGKTFASMTTVWRLASSEQSAASASGRVYQKTPPENVIEKGDLIIRLPASHLTFHGVEALF